MLEQQAGKPLNDDLKDLRIFLMESKDGFSQQREQTGHRNIHILINIMQLHRKKFFKNQGLTFKSHPNRIANSTNRTKLTLVFDNLI